MADNNNNTQNDETTELKELCCQLDHLEVNQACSTGSCAGVSTIEDDTPAHTIKSTLKDLNLEGVASSHPPRVLVLYGSLRPEAYSKKLSKEVCRGLTKFGCEVKTFDPHKLPVFDRQSNDHPEVKKLRELSIWSEAQCWISPEQHGSMTAVFKNQIDWLPLSEGSVRPTQGRTLAVFEVSGGSQSFNTVNQLRILGRWMRMITIPNQSSIPKAWSEFDECGRMKPSSLRMRVIDVCEELFRFTLMTRDRIPALVTRASEQKELREKGQLTPGQGVQDVTQKKE
eukprot:CAMPEP_0201530502 /NCGR_PEP_ID=MMETSP0161_2-20130828/44881_1 /ASSEMBLY_ACC=CAM_ASM_000251 /TAXON_ID=180227 /ORGANISM="Neoparamoeba aestuarina, Strain SoJaBio B1-5/56/2" /LENGTH=283 /DNA_ID=CAMNT_0047932895 /DNA_START=170 /DNA_END=1021 /DNA_ORIENTATION=-